MLEFNTDKCFLLSHKIENFFIFSPVIQKLAPLQVPGCG